MQIVAVFALIFAIVFGGMVLTEVINVSIAGSAITGVVGEFYNVLQAIGLVWYVGFFVVVLLGALTFAFASRRG